MRADIQLLARHHEHWYRHDPNFRACGSKIVMAAIWRLQGQRCYGKQGSVDNWDHVRTEVLKLWQTILEAHQQSR